MESVKGNAIVTMRDYRKGNWTLEETLVLIEAKKLEGQRRMLKNPSTSSSGELRWKWIEEYCMKKGCFRSQNQCNDKWDNMMRDFKKVRDFERRRCDDNDNEEHHKNISYWKMDKIQRKNNNLPSNMLPQIYQALAHVVEAKLGSSVLPTIVIHPDTTTTPPHLPLPPPPPSPPQESLPKRRRSSEGGSRSISEQISSSASVLIEAIKGYDEREEARHKELYNMHQRRYKIEESKIELERQGFNELVGVINNLSNSIFAFTSQRTRL
ncbi:hypothetical protein L1987_05893 [Smallanthus sonchifolius]|uniref:Uncharacterized protein n=1 Tax=Smallanthus sonchifolius TaxID=185202 RepID=A0ACB9JX07_9ASTR|nr:hypothetical protein L1987_05893 [Smallanthus sonchifolius]